MQTAVLKYGDVSPEQLKMFLEMRSIFERLPEFPFEEPFNLSCHMVARAFAENYPVEVVDGYFSLGVCHSWLVLERRNFQDHGENGNVIADLFPVGSAVPFLVYTRFNWPWAQIYLEEPSVSEWFRDHPEFLRRVDLVATKIDQLRNESG